MIWFHLIVFFFKTEEGEISGSDEETGDEDRVSGPILDKLGVYMMKNIAKNVMISCQLSLNLDLKKSLLMFVLWEVFSIPLGGGPLVHNNVV